MYFLHAVSHSIVMYSLYYVPGAILMYSLYLLPPQTNTLDNKPNYDKGRGICLLSLVDTTNIYFQGKYGLTVPQSAGQQSLTVPQSAGQSDLALPESESN